MKRIVCAAALVLLAASFGTGLDFSLKITGGGAYASVGDYNSGIDGMNSYYADHYSNVNGRFAKVRWGADFQVELMADITRDLGIGLGVGYLRVSHSGDEVGYDWTFLSSTYHNTETQAILASAIPVTLNAYVRVPLAGLSVRIFGGVGFTFGSMAFDSTFQSDFLEIGETVAFKACKNAFGFQGGISLDIPLGSDLSLVIDVTGRAVRLSEIQGDYELTPAIFGITQPTATGDDYFFWYYEQKPGGTTYPMTGVGLGAPSGLNARHGRFDLSGVSARAGLKLSL